MSAVDIELGQQPPAAPADTTPANDDLAAQFKEAILGSKINVLYVGIPLSVIFNYGGWSDSLTFVTSFLALVPLAAALGDFTEDISLRTNDATAALINVTFGNATELIISLMALRAGQYDIIKYSLVGSVLGNMLLVMGSSLLLAGLKNPSLTFNVAATNTYLSTLVLSCFSFLIPTAFATLNTKSEDPKFALNVSRQIAVLMIAVYGGYLYFQQKTHKHLFDGEPTPDAPAITEGEGDVPAEEEEEPKYSFWFSFIAIGVIAVLISWLSDFLVDSIEGAAEGLHLSKHFIGLVLVPIVGNVAEHASAVMMAMKMKMDIAIGVALGSSVQIGMFVMPLIVLVAWPLGEPLGMDFTPFTCGCLFAAVILTFAVANSGSATWLSGAKLVAAYAMLSLAYANAPDS